MRIDAFGPSLLVEDVPASAHFYVEHFGFRPRLELDWFTTLTHDDRPYELGFLRADHQVVPEGTAAAGQMGSSSDCRCPTRPKWTPGCAPPASASCCRCETSRSASAT
jgi:hypothetical protein